MKALYFETIERILDNEKNDIQHLESLQVTVSMFTEMFGKCESSTELQNKYSKLEVKLNN